MLNKFIDKVRGISFIKDSFWALFGNISLRGLSLISGIMVARYLAPEEYGAFSTLKGFILAMTVFATLGMGYSSTFFIANYIKNNNKYILSTRKFLLKVTFLFSSSITLILIVFSDYIAKEYLKDYNLSISLKIVAISNVFNALSFTETGILYGFKKFKGISLINTKIGILSFIITILLTYLYSFNGTIISLLISSIINYYFICKESIKTSKLFCNEKTSILITTSIKKEIIKESIPISLQELIYTLSAWISTILVVRYTDYLEVAKYSIAMQWSAIIIFLPSVLRNVFLSYFSSGDSETRDKLLKYTLLFNFIIVGIPTVIILVFSNKIYYIYGFSYTGLHKVLSITILATVFTVSSNVYLQVLITLKKNWLILFIRLTREILTIGLFLLIFFKNFKLGVLAMCFASLITNILFLIVLFFLYQSISKKNISDDLVKSEM